MDLEVRKYSQFTFINTKNGLNGFQGLPRIAWIVWMHAISVRFNEWREIRFLGCNNREEEDGGDKEDS